LAKTPLKFPTRPCDFANFPERDYHIDFIDPDGYPDNSESYSEIYTSKPLPVLQF